MTWRDLRCGEPRPDRVGRRLALAGWVARRRDHGGLVFIDLRDRTGVTQLVINPERSPDAAETSKEIRNEFVLRARGEVVARSSETVNPAMPTGGVEPTEESLRRWFKAGIACAGIGSRLITKELLAAADYDGIARNVERTIGIIKKIRTE